MYGRIFPFGKLRREEEREGGERKREGKREKERGDHRSWWTGLGKIPNQSTIKVSIIIILVRGYLFTDEHNPCTSPEEFSVSPCTNL